MSSPPAHFEACNQVQSPGSDAPALDLLRRSLCAVTQPLLSALLLLALCTPPPSGDDVADFSPRSRNDALDLSPTLADCLYENARTFTPSFYVTISSQVPDIDPADAVQW